MSGVSLENLGRYPCPVGVGAQVTDHCPHTVEPSVNDRRVDLEPPNSHFRAEFQVADALHQRVGQRQAAVLRQLAVARAADRVQEHQGLVQGERADGILEQQLLLRGGKSLQRGEESRSGVDSGRAFGALSPCCSRVRLAAAATVSA